MIEASDAGHATGEHVPITGPIVPEEEVLQVIQREPMLRIVRPATGEERGRSLAV